jgi:hypothetical protein
MFIVTWFFDKLGYMPKIDMQVGKVNIDAQWPFPITEITSLSEKPKKKVIVPKATTKKPKVAAKTTRIKKAK